MKKLFLRKRAIDCQQVTKTKNMIRDFFKWTQMIIIVLLVAFFC